MVALPSGRQLHDRFAVVESAEHVNAIDLTDEKLRRRLLALCDEQFLRVARTIQGFAVRSDGCGRKGLQRDAAHPVRKCRVGRGFLHGSAA